MGGIGSIFFSSWKNPKRCMIIDLTANDRKEEKVEEEKKKHGINICRCTTVWYMSNYALVNRLRKVGSNPGLSGYEENPPR